MRVLADGRWWRWLLVGGVLLVLSGGAEASRWTDEDFIRRTRAQHRFADDDQTVVGELRAYAVRDGDTLLDVARYFGLGYNEMVAANPGVDPWVPPVGQVVIIPTEFVLPSTSLRGVVVNIPEMRLYHFREARQAPTTVTTYPVGLGRDDWQTPRGRFKIRGKTANPTWVIPDSIRAEHIRDRGDARTFIPGGAPDNPLGSYRLELTLPMYALHGTNVPWGVGMQVSHGCIRLYEEDIAVLFQDVAVGTPGEFLYQPVKLGTRDGVIFIEVHPDIYDLTPDAEAEVRQRLDENGWLDLVDEARVRRALAEESGLPVAISRSAFYAAP